MKHSLPSFKDEYKMAISVFYYKKAVNLITCAMVSYYHVLSLYLTCLCILFSKKRKKKKKKRKQIHWEKECLINGIETNSYLFGIKIKVDPYTLHHIEKYIYY